MALDVAYPDSGNFRSATVLPPAYGLSAIAGTLPPAYGLNETTLDFMLPVGLDPRITFTRSTVGTYRNSSVTLLTAAINAARANALQDHDSDGDPLGFLIEAGATNLLVRSQQFDNASWPVVNLTVAANSTTAPDGTTTADTLTSTAAGGLIQQSVTVAADTTTYTYSVWLKNISGTTDTQLLLEFGAGAAFRTATIVWSGATLSSITPGSSATASFQAGQNGWYRVTITAANTSQTTVKPWIRPSSAGTAAVYAWGAQLEASAFATSYIATTTAATARGADNGVISNLASIGFSATQGFVYTRFAIEGVPALGNYLFAFSDGTTNNVIRVLYDGTSLRFQVISGGAVQANIAIAAALVAGTPYKCACSWSAGAFRFALSGSAATEDTSGSVPTVDLLDIGRQSTIAYLYGWLPELQYGPQLLTSAQLAAMTA